MNENFSGIKSDHQERSQKPVKNEKYILPLVLLLFLLPGIHRFYIEKPISAILFIITFGGFFIWWLIDFILVVSGIFKDKHNRNITKWHA